jgi:hypothetical protein
MAARLTTIEVFCLNYKILPKQISMLEKRRGATFGLNCLKINFTAILCLIFMNTFAQEKESKMQNSFMSIGEYISYYILPIKKRVQLVLINDQEQFSTLLRTYKGQPLSKTEITLQKADDIENPFYLREISLARVYLLSNGLVAVDRSNVSKANPYYLCESLRAFQMIAQYLIIFPVEENGNIRTTIKCVINHDHFKIKQFLNTVKMKIISDDPDSGYKLFVSDDGKGVCVRYVANISNSERDTDLVIKNLTKSFIDPKYQNENPVYHDLEIYESIDVMKSLGVLGAESSDIDEENFLGFYKQLLVRDGKSIVVEVLNSKKAYRDERNNGTKVASQEFDSALMDIIRCKSGEIVAKFSTNISLKFKNEADFSAYSSFRKDVDAKYPEEIGFDLFSEKIKHEVANPDYAGNIFDFFEVDFQNKTLEQSLVDVDGKINQYFFDDYFIKLYFPGLAVCVGNLVNTKQGSTWKYDERLKRNIIVTQSKKIIDFIPYLYEEMLRQRYTGFCSSEAIIGGLLMASHLNIVK